MKSSFYKLMRETKDPFHKLFYEILSRYHRDDFYLAVSGMSAELEQIIMDCKKEIDNEKTD